MSAHPISFVSYPATIARYWNLISRLAAREFAARYRGSHLGVLWAALTPLVTVLVFTFVFGVVFRAKWAGESTATSEFVIILFVGMIIHGIFVEAISRAPTLILNNSSYVKRVVFPLEILPLVVVITAVINAAVGFVVVIVAHLILNGELRPTLIFLPFVLAPYILAVLGLTMFVTSIGVFIRDIGHAVGFLITVTLFMAPIFYPISSVPEPYRVWLYLNPLTFTVEEARAVAIFGRSPDWEGLGLYTAGALFVFAAGYAWFQKTRNGFADVV